jgi:hypothetical protein
MDNKNRMIRGFAVFFKQWRAHSIVYGTAPDRFMSRRGHSYRDTFQPTSYRAPHSGQTRMVRYTSRVDLREIEIELAATWRNETWNPS